MNPDLLNTILGAGGLAFLLALGQAIRWIIERVSAREDKVEAKTRRYEKETVRRLTWEAKQHDWWRNRAAQCEYVITSRLGPEALPEKRPYPREPAGEDDDLKAVEKS
jgi:hypothetical protein